MKPHSGDARSARIGLLSIFVVWLTGPITVPIVPILKARFSPEEILIVRSLFGAIASLCIIGGNIWSADIGLILRLRIILRRIWKADAKVKWAGLIIGPSSLTFYHALQTWAVNPVMMILTLLPVVNIFFALRHGRKVSLVVITSFVILLYGLMRALDPWGNTINVTGLILAVSCVILGGVGFELWGQVPSRTTISEMCFWLSMPLILICLTIVMMSPAEIDYGKYTDPRSLLLLGMLGLINGIVYMYATIAPFNKFGKMNTVVASVLIQGTTPFTMVGSYYIIGETLSVSQQVGVAIALCGAAMLSGWLVWKPKGNS